MDESNQKVTGSLFMELVQMHERAWGNEEYPGRPTLAQLLNAPIVAMWVEQKRLSRRADEERFRLKPYATAADIHADLSNIVLLGKQSGLVGYRLAKLFIDQNPVQIVGVKLITGTDTVPPERQTRRKG